MNQRRLQGLYSIEWGKGAQTGVNPKNETAS
jgi:hypothetical protein